MGRIRVKICGITTVEDARLAADLGADAIGLNFYERSPRYLPPAASEPILRALPPFVEPVGLVVNVTPLEAMSILGGWGKVRTLQWHGVHPLPTDVRPFELIPAFAVHDCDSLLAITRYLGACAERGWLPPAILTDAHVPGQYGGTGRTAPWELLAGFRPGVPILLAGGLTPENVNEAIRTVQPYGVDVASSVESSPGRKDADKMRRFIEAAHEAAHRHLS